MKRGSRQIVVPLCAVLMVFWQGRENASRNGFDACKLLTVSDITPLLGPGRAALHLSERRSPQEIHGQNTGIDPI
jgi:hypothetical protein